MSVFKISNGYFHLWKTCLQSKNLNWRQLDLSAEQQQQLEHILSLPIDTQSDMQFFLDLIEVSRQQWSLPNLVLDMAYCISPANFGVLGYMASNSATLAQAIQYVMRFHRLVIDSEQVLPLHITEYKNKIRLYWPLVDEQMTVLCELTLAAMVHLARQIIPEQQLFLQAVEFVHFPKVSLLNYQKFFQCTLKFQQPYYAITFARESLNSRPYQADSTLIQLLVRQAEEALASKATAQDLTQQIHWIVGEYLKQQQRAPLLEWIADELHLSVRSLQRALKKQDTSFKEIVDLQTMKRCELLLVQNESLNRIAEQLGYSDQSALARAYKRVRGSTLLALRRAQQ